MRLMVCGGPSFTNFELVERELTQLSGQHRIAVIIHGWVGPLAGRLDRWGRKHDVQISRYLPDGNSNGRDADARRNESILSDSRPTSSSRSRAIEISRTWCNEPRGGASRRSLFLNLCWKPSKSRPRPVSRT
jgi:hypothetical protein